MGKNIPWHGKVSQVENQCPHCGANNEYSDKYKTVMEISAQHFKLCIKCQGEFVDTYLIDFPEYAGGDDAQAMWESERRFDDEKEDQAQLFEDLESEGFLMYDDYEGREDSDYYDIKPKSIHFITGEDDEERK